MYHGANNMAVDYFKKLGYPCPKNSNPADFIFYRIVNNETENGAAFNAMEMGSMGSMEDKYEKPSGGVISVKNDKGEKKDVEGGG